ncbi:MAG: alpha/beta fold hydrolase [Ekhidna sp.]|nr:alpha/beta fold hydrolase [Ekhidna sp.]
MAQQNKLPTYKYPVKYVDLEAEIKMAYVDEGQKSLPVLLMIHGLGGSIKNWYFTIDSLSESFRCIALDLPGYGLSTMKYFSKYDEDYLGFFAETVDTFAKALDLKNVTLIGHSMGGQVSIIAALDKPLWLKNLVLASPAGFETFEDHEAKALIDYGSASAIMSHSEAQVRAAYAANFVEMPEPLTEEMIQDRLSAKNQIWFEDYAKVREFAVRGMLGHPIRTELNRVSYPTLVVFGAEDLLIPNRFFHPSLTVDSILQVGGDIPNVTLKKIPNAGHMLQLDNASAFNKLIVQFLNPN